jgi:thymidylate synthase
VVDKVIQVPDLVDGYVDVVEWVYRTGREVSPRGMKTVEIEDALIIVDNPWATLPMGVGRGIVPGIGVVEALQLLGGVSTPETVIAVGPQFANYAEDSGLFHGAYGPRTRGQYAEVVRKLRQDPDSRQAVVTIWDPKLDNLPEKRDYPCTVLHQFRIRDGRLNMSVYMRSNDVWLGLGYDGWQFTRVQIALASVLGVEVGTYAHHVGSLHLYEQHYDAAQRLRYYDDDDNPYPSRQPAITGKSWDDVAVAAKFCLDAHTSERVAAVLVNDDERWFADAIKTAIDKNAAKKSQADQS